MFQISTRLTVVCLLTLPLAVLVMKFLAAVMMQRSRLVQRQLGKLTETIRELLRAHTLLSIYPVFNSLFRRFSDENNAYRNRSENVQNLRIIVTNFAVAVASLATFILMVVGGPLVIDGAFGIAEFVEYSVYLGLVQEPMRSWGFLISIFQRGEVCLERIYDIRDLADDVNQR
jgi:ABC-type multidrug transport system fused ATPase/permease subunit